MLAKKAGFNFVELSIDESDERLARLEWSEQQWDDLLGLCHKHQIYFRSMCLSAHRRYPLGSSDPGIQAHGLKIFDQALKICQKMQIKIIQLAGYDVYYEPSTEQTKADFAKNLAIIAQKAMDQQIVLGIETMDTPFLGTAERIRSYIESINIAALRIYPDLGNLFQWSPDPIFDVTNNVNYFVQVHIKATKPNTFRDLDWHESNVDYYGLINALNQNHYAHHFVAEFWAKDGDQNIDHQVNSLNEAYKFVKQKLLEGNYQIC